MKKIIFLFAMLSVITAKSQPIWNVGAVFEIQPNGDWIGEGIYEGANFQDIYILRKGHDTLTYQITTDSVLLDCLDSTHNHGTPSNVVWVDEIGTLKRSPISSINISQLNNDGFFEGNRSQTNISGLAATTAYTITHGLSYTPTSISISAKSADAAPPHFVTNITSTTFDIVFVSQPNIGTNNIIFDWTAYK